MLARGRGSDPAHQAPLRSQGPLWAWGTSCVPLLLQAILTLRMIGLGEKMEITCLNQRPGYLQV